MAALTDLAAHELAAAIAAGEVSCREVMQALPRPHRRAQPAAQRDRQPARRRRAAARGRPLATSSWRATTAASRRGRSCSACRRRSRTWCRRPASAAPRARRCSRTSCPTADSLLVQRMKAAGCIVIGKTNTPEFGLGSHTFNEVFGATRNAFDPTRVGRRQQRRRRGRARHPHAAGGRRQRLDGEPAQPGGLEQRVRLSPEPGPGAELAGGGRLGHALRHRRADGAQRPRPRPAARRAGRLRRARAALARHRAVVRRAARGERRRAHAGVRIGWLGDLDGHLAMEDGILDVCAAGLARLEGDGCSVEPTALGFAPERLWDAWLKWRGWIVYGRIAPHLADAGEPRPDQARGAVGARQRRRSSAPRR